MRGNKIEKDKSGKALKNRRALEERRRNEAMEAELRGIEKDAKAALYEAKGYQKQMENRRKGVMAALRNAGMGGSLLDGEEALTDEERGQLLDAIDREMGEGK